MSIAPRPKHQSLESHEDGRSAFKDDRIRERTLDESERAEFGAATRATRRLGIAVAMAIRRCMFMMSHLSAFSTYDTEWYVK